MTMDRLRSLGFLLAFLILGVVLFSLYGAFRGAIEGGNWVAFLGGILLGAAMITFLMIVMIVPDRRSTRWVRSITNINAKYLFGLLILVWIATMGLLASLELPANTVGAPALIGLFAGIFIFMGFIWAVIGE
jgi:predicted Co/Zn/Cd cation transporter (cation efflux family)